jgi:hypothetical protein
MTEISAFTSDAHIAGGVMKQFLRDLLDGVFPSVILEEVKSAGDNLESLKQVISKLPKENYALLKRLLELCLNISKYQETNKMGWPNLTLVITPNVFKGNDNDIYMTDNMKMSTVVHSLMVNFDEIFGAVSKPEEKQVPREDSGSDIVSFDPDDIVIVEPVEQTANSAATHQSVIDELQDTMKSPPLQEDQEVSNAKTDETLKPDQILTIVKKRRTSSISSATSGNNVFATPLTSPKDLHQPANVQGSTFPRKSKPDPPGPIQTDLSVNSAKRGYSMDSFPVGLSIASPRSIMKKPTDENLSSLISPTKSVRFELQPALQEYPGHSETSSTRSSTNASSDDDREESDSSKQEENKEQQAKKNDEGLFGPLEDSGPTYEDEEKPKVEANRDNKSDTSRVSADKIDQTSDSETLRIRGKNSKSETTAAREAVDEPHARSESRIRRRPSKKHEKESKDQEGLILEDLKLQDNVQKKFGLDKRRSTATEDYNLFLSPKPTRPESDPPKARSLRAPELPVFDVPSKPYYRMSSKEKAQFEESMATQKEQLLAFASYLKQSKASIQNDKSKGKIEWEQKLVHWKREKQQYDSALEDYKSLVKFAAEEPKQEIFPEKPKERVQVKPDSHNEQNLLKEKHFLKKEIRRLKEEIKQFPKGEGVYLVLRNNLESLHGRYLEIKSIIGE